MSHWTSGAWGAVASGFAALFTLLGAILVIWQIRRVRKQAVYDYQRRSKQAAIDFYSVSLDQRAEWQLLLPPDRESGLIGELIEQALRPRQEEKRRIIHNYLGFWELLAAAIEEEVVDKTTAVRIARGRMVAVCTNYASFIQRERSKQEAPRLYCELQNLVRTLISAEERAELDVSLPVPPDEQGMKSTGNQASVL
jgi:Domain of unknown function (DUF4760)